MNNKKINFGFQLNKNNKITSFCNLSLQNIIKERNLKVSINSSQSAEISLSDKNSELNFSKKEEKISNSIFKTLSFSFIKRFSLTDSLSYSLFCEKKDEEKENDLFYKINYKNKFVNLVAGMKDNFSVFTKSVLCFKKELKLTPFFSDFKLSFGQLSGNPPCTEYFILGNEIKGYNFNDIKSQHEVGKSFIQSNNKVGLVFKNLKIFLFSDFGFYSSHNNLINTAQSLTCCLVNKTYPKNMALSVGGGVSFPFSFSKNDVTAFIAFPLINEISNEKMKIGIVSDL